MPTLTALPFIRIHTALRKFCSYLLFFIECLAIFPTQYCYLPYWSLKLLNIQSHILFSGFFYRPRYSSDSVRGWFWKSHRAPSPILFLMFCTSYACHSLARDRLQLAGQIQLATCSVKFITAQPCPLACAFTLQWDCWVVMTDRWTFTEKVFWPLVLPMNLNWGGPNPRHRNLLSKFKKCIHLTRLWPGEQGL